MHRAPLIDLMAISVSLSLSLANSRADAPPGPTDASTPGSTLAPAPGSAPSDPPIPARILARVAPEADGDFTPAPGVVDADRISAVTLPGHAVFVLDRQGAAPFGGLRFDWSGRPPASVIIEQSSDERRWGLVRSIEAPDWGALPSTTWTITPGAGARYLRVSLYADERTAISGQPAPVSLAEVLALDASLGKSVVSLVRQISAASAPGLFPRDLTPTADGQVRTEAQAWDAFELKGSRGAPGPAPTAPTASTAPTISHVSIQPSAMIDGKLLTWASAKADRDAAGLGLSIEPDATGRAARLTLSNVTSKPLRGELRLAVRGPSQPPPAEPGAGVLSDELTFERLGLGLITRERDGALKLDGTHRLRVGAVGAGLSVGNPRLATLTTGDALATDTRFVTPRAECVYRWATAVVPVVLDLPPGGSGSIRVELGAIEK